MAYVDSMFIRGTPRYYGRLILSFFKKSFILFFKELTSDIPATSR